MYLVEKETAGRKDNAAIRELKNIQKFKKDWIQQSVRAILTEIIQGQTENNKKFRKK